MNTHLTAGVLQLQNLSREELDDLSKMHARRPPDSMQSACTLRVGNLTIENVYVVRFELSFPDCTLDSTGRPLRGDVLIEFLMERKPPDTEPECAINSTNPAGV